MRSTCRRTAAPRAGLLLCLAASADARRHRESKSHSDSLLFAALEGPSAAQKAARAQAAQAAQEAAQDEVKARRCTKPVAPGDGCNKVKATDVIDGAAHDKRVFKSHAMQEARCNVRYFCGKDGKAYACVEKSMSFGNYCARGRGLGKHTDTTEWTACDIDDADGDCVSEATEIVQNAEKAKGRLVAVYMPGWVSEARSTFEAFATNELVRPYFKASYLLDPPGVGKNAEVKAKRRAGSDDDIYSVEVQAMNAVQFIRHTVVKKHPGKTVMLVGHSWGAIVAMKAAALLNPHGSKAAGATPIGLLLLDPGIADGAVGLLRILCKLSYQGEHSTIGAARLGAGKLSREIREALGDLKFPQHALEMTAAIKVRVACGQ